MTDTTRRASRRRLLALVLIGGVGVVSLEGCASVPAVEKFASRLRPSFPTAVPSVAPTPPATAAIASTTAVPGTPSPAPTPQNTPGAVAAAYISAWNDGRYSDMWDLISADAQQRTPRDAFVQRYTNIAIQVTLTKLSARLTPGQRADINIQHFVATFETVLVGTFQEQNALTLAVNPNTTTWRVQWLPSLIFTELTGDNLVHMFPIGTPRGDIRDRNGIALATAGTVATVSLLPEKITDETTMLSQLSALLGMPAAVIKQKYVQSEPNVQATIKTMTTVAAAPIRAKLAAIPGVVVQDTPARVYPHATLAAQTVGYISQVTADDLKTLAARGYRPGDVIGRAGIEQWGEQALAGQWGGKLMVITPKSDPVTTIAQREPAKAGAVYLTVDTALQQRCEDLLGKRAGSVGVMRVGDGSLLALASYPGFDPNAFVLGISTAAFNALANDPLKPFLNRLVEGFYPTGSIFKPITMAAALDHAGYTEQSAFNCPGWYTLGDTTWHCWKTSGHGHIGIVSALTQSCDVAFYTMGHQEDTLNGDMLPTEAKGFDLGAWPQLVGLGGAQATGAVPSPAWKQATYREGWVPGDAVNLSIGQGYLLASPLQMLVIYAALANGGTLWTPRVVDKVVDANGQVTNANPAKPLGTLPISANALQLIRQGLHDVVATPVGTASAAFQGLPTAAGKTGTAQAGSGQPHAWFAAFAPFDQPQIAVIAMVEHGGEGATVAAPLVRGVLDAYFGGKH